MERWSSEDIWKLIDLMEENATLFDTKHKDHINRVKKEEIYGDIAEKLEYIRPNTTPKEVESKIRSLRDNYLRERRKVENSIKSGAGTDQVYVPKWIYYERLHFTCRNINSRKSGNSGSVNKTTSTSTTTTSTSTTSTATSTPVPFITSSQSMFPDFSLEESQLSTVKVSQKKAQKSEASQLADNAMEVANQVLAAVNAQHQNEPTTANERDEELLTAMGKHMWAVQDEELYDQLVRGMWNLIFDAKMKQRQVTERQCSNYSSVLPPENQEIPARYPSGVSFPQTSSSIPAYSSVFRPVPHEQYYPQALSSSISPTPSPSSPRQLRHPTHLPINIPVPSTSSPRQLRPPTHLPINIPVPSTSSLRQLRHPKHVPINIPVPLSSSTRAPCYPTPLPINSPTPSSSTRSPRYPTPLPINSPTPSSSTRSPRYPTYLPLNIAIPSPSSKRPPPHPTDLPLLSSPAGVGFATTAQASLADAETQEPINLSPTKRQAIILSDEPSPYTLEEVIDGSGQYKFLIREQLSNFLTFVNEKK